MNKYLENLNRIEFVITYACTGRCKHCSEGEHTALGEHIDDEKARELVKSVAEKYQINSLMTFGGEPLIYPETVCAIHSMAREMNIPKRQLITNGFFSRDIDKIKSVAQNLIQSGVNDILLSVDAFHQETIPIEPVKVFADEIHKSEIRIRVQPAWLVGKEHGNPYNRQTVEILKQFKKSGFQEASGNVIFPSGNALKYLGDYFDPNIEYVIPYEENPRDIHVISIDPNGDVLNDNIYCTDILKIFEKYEP